MRAILRASPLPSWLGMRDQSVARRIGRTITNAASIVKLTGPARPDRRAGIAAEQCFPCWTIPPWTMATPTAATLVSLSQNNLVGLMASAVFGAQKLNDNAIAIVENIAWGTGP